MKPSIQEGPGPAAAVRSPSQRKRGVCVCGGGSPRDRQENKKRNLPARRLYLFLRAESVLSSQAGCFVLLSSSSAGLSPPHPVFVSPQSGALTRAPRFGTRAFCRQRRPRAAHPRPHIGRASRSPPLTSQVPAHPLTVITSLNHAHRWNTRRPPNAALLRLLLLLILLLLLLNVCAEARATCIHNQHPRVTGRDS